VVTARGTAMEEIADGASILIDPRRVDEIETGLRAALEDERLRRDLAVAGPARARRFTWVRTARAMWSAYREASQR